MRIEGWPCKDRNHAPRIFNGDDVRRIVGAWREYGGLGSDGRAKDTPAYQINPEEIVFNEQRAVFSTELLLDVVTMLKKRATLAPDCGHKKRDRVYLLRGLLRCAHCERLAQENNDTALRTRLGGTSNDKLRYRHTELIKCGVKRRSVPCDIVDADFAQLAKQLTIRPNQENAIQRLAIQFLKRQQSDYDPASEEQKRQEAIKACRMRMTNLKHAFLKRLEISAEEYDVEMDEVKRELVYWESYTTDLEQTLFELSKCIEAVNQFATLWDSATKTNRQKMVTALFQSIIYDLDKQRIVDFTLQPWAERFIVLRTQIENENTENEGELGVKSMVQNVPPEGFQPSQVSILRSIVNATYYLLLRLYNALSKPQRRRTTALDARDNTILNLIAQGVHPNVIAPQFGITPERVYQIINQHKNR